MPIKNPQLSGSIALILLATIYGFIGYFSRALAPGLSLWQQLYIRLIPAIPLLWLTFYKRIQIANCLAACKQEPLVLVVRALCLYTIPVPLYFYATQHASLGDVALLQVLPYIFILGIVFNKERPTIPRIGLMLLALFGALVVTTQSGLSLTHLGRGELASIACGIVLSFGFITRKWHKSNLNNYELSLSLITIGTIFTLLASLLWRDGLPHPRVTNLHFGIILLLAAYLNCLIILLANYGFHHVRDTLANNIMALEGVFGIIFGYLIYREAPSAREVIGGCFILVSAIWSTYLLKNKSTI